MAGKSTTLPLKRKRPPFKLHVYYPSKQRELFDRVYNYTFNKLYPIKPSVFAIMFFIALAYFVYDPTKMPQQLGSSLISICVTSFLFVLLPVIVFRVFLWAFFFRYKRYLFENPKRPSLTTKFWVVCSKILRRLAPPRLETCDSLLPRLHVPRLCDTITRYLESMKPILGEEEFIELKQLAREFEQKEGKKLNLYAWVYSWYAKNYVTDFWQKYLYLYGRDPLLINSNFSHIDTVKMPPGTTQVSRAAELCYIAALNMMAIENQSQKPIADGLCYNGHYKKLYSTTRIPKVGCDEWAINRYSRHVTVYLKGCFYKVDLFDKKTNRLYSVEELQEIFIELLLRENERQPSDVEQKLAALTQDNRDTWARNRQKFFLENPKNRQFLKEVEDSIVFLILDDKDYGFDGSNETMTEFQRSMLTGNGANRWADKSMCFIVGRNGGFGGNSEHSIADGAEFDTVLENFVYISNNFINRPKDPIDIDKLKNFQPKSDVALAEQLEFEFNEEMGSEIERCYVEQVERSNDLDAQSIMFTDFGKEKIKKANCSPDAFFQMALQLTNYKDQSKFVLTYEAASGRFYDYSRTETLRSASEESCEFVNAMINKLDKQKCSELLRKACESHVNRNRMAMTGQGVDRHIFVLLVLSKGLGLKSEFLEKYASQKWLLSTSQPPIMTNLLNEHNEHEQWMGGSFGAVAHEGTGICYRFVGKDSIVFHITSYHSAKNTCTKRFRTHLEESLKEMIELFA